MRKIIKNLSYIGLFFILILGCTKDVDIQDQFDFDTNIIVQDSGYVYEAAPMDIKINPKRQVIGTSYKLSFKVQEGGAYLEAGSDPVQTIKKDEVYKFSTVDKSQIFKFYPTTVGVNKILVTIEDSNGLKKTKEIVYKAKLAPFTFLMMPNLNAYTINARGAITSTLIRNLEDNFSFSYLVENGTGTLYNGNEAIAIGKPYQMTGGAMQLHYVPTTLGTHKITAIATASDGAKITRTVEIIVDNVPFTLNATTTSTTINVNQELNINIDLTELQKGISSSYELTHSFDSKGISGTLKNALTGNVLNAGVFSSITPGTYQYKFKATTQGTSTLTFKVKDTNGQIKETSVIITVTNVPFTLTGTSTEKSILLNNTSKLNFNIVPNTNDSAGVIYNFVYQAEAGDGILTDADGKTIQRGAPIVVSKGVFSFNYKPTSLGSHILNCVVTDNNGENRSVKIEMESIHSPVTFNVSSVTQTYVNQGVFVDFTVTPQLNTDLKYEMNYFISGGQGQLKNYDTVIKTGEYSSINKGGFKYNFIPNVAGNYVLTFELKDSNGQIISKNLSLVVLNNKFTFTPTASQKVFVNEANTFSCALVPTGSYNGTTYNVSYSIEAGQLGTFSHNGTEIQQGIPIKVTPTSFNLTYKPTTKGDHKIHYIVTDSNGLKEEIVQTISVIASDFNLKIQQANTKIYKNNPDALLLSLSQENQNINIGYSMTYTVTGVGAIYRDGVALPNFATITPGNQNLSFSSNQSGNTEIVFTVVDTNGISHSQTVKYTTLNADFSVSTSGDGTLNLNKSKEFNVYLSQLVADPTATYQVRYLLDSGSIGSGKVYNGAMEVPLGIFQNINIGSSVLSFKGLSAGVVNLKVEIKDSNGVTHTSMVALEVLAINYSFTGSAQSNSIYLNATTPINFDVTESASSGTNYEIKYAFIEGNGQIKNGANIENANTWYPVSIGSSSRTFVGTATGDVKLLFTLRNTTTLVEKTQNIAVKVNASDYTFTATATDNNLTSKTPINVNFNLAQIGGGTETYSMTFSTTGTGTFMYGGATYTAGQTIPITVGSSNGSYKGTTAGAHDLVFTVVNQNSVQKISSVKLMYNPNDFTLSTSGDGSLNANTTKSFNTFLSQGTTDSAITYQAKFVVATGSTGAGTISLNGANVPFGTFQTIAVGNTGFTFKGTNPGTVNIEITVKDSNNITHTSTVALEVLAINYSFTGSAQANSIYVNTSTPVNFDITESAASGTSYEMKYVITEGAGTLKNGITQESANTWYPVSVGAFNRTFVGNQTGTVKLNFTVRNTTTLVEKTQNITIEVNASEFAFTATATDNNLTAKTPINVNLNLTQIGGGNETYKMTFSTTGTGTFVYNGTPYTAGQLIPITVGANFGIYKGTTAGAHDVTFTVLNQNSVQKNATIKLNYIANDFTLSTSGDGTLNANTSKSFNCFVSQNNTDNAITYEVKFNVVSGSTGDGTISLNGANVPFGTFQNIAVGNTGFVFKGTTAGTVNIQVTVKDSNNITHTSTVALEVLAINYTFTGAAQNNSISVNGTTPVNFDITESANSGTAYEMKYVITEGNGQIKNGANTENANTWNNVSIGSFNRTIVGTQIGNLKITFTVRNKTTLAEKTQVLTITVKASEFTFSANRTSNNEPLSSSIGVNFNLSQIGGGTETYNMIFSSSGTGTFTYGGTVYTPGQTIPFQAGSTNGNYKGTTAGTHDITFTVTNQELQEKSASIKLTYFVNDFNLSTTGDGTLTLNQNKNINVFLSQLFPNPNISYEVQFNILQTSVGSGIILDGTNQITTGSYNSISLGTKTFSFKGTASGEVNLEITVKDSNNITHKSTILFNVKSGEFFLTGAIDKNICFVNSNATANFSLTELQTSGSQYEIKYNILSGYVTIKNGINLENPNTWHSVAVGNFNRTITPLVNGQISIEFIVRNTITLVEKKVIIDFTGYIKPTLSNIRTYRGLRNNFILWSHYLSGTLVLDPSATLSKMKFICINGSGESLNKDIANSWKNSTWVELNNVNEDLFRNWDWSEYTITIQDSNGFTTTITGVFTNDPNDNY
jgi:hypothetical protein